MVSDDALIRIALLLVVVFFVLPLVVMVLMMPLMGIGWMGTGSGGFGLLWFLPWVFALVMLLGAGYAVYVLFGGGADGSDAALEELRMAYARGELTDDEFQRRRERLRREE